MAIGRVTGKKYSLEHMGNSSFDDDLQINTVQIAEYDPNGTPRRRMTDQLTMRVDDSTSNTIYLGYAQIGSAESGAVWQIQKVDTSSGASIKWADANSEYDNIWDNRASLTYS